MKKALILVSGGMDSATLLACLLFPNTARPYAPYKSGEVLAVSFHYGSLHQAAESVCAQRICDHYGVARTIIELPKLKGSALTGSSELPANRTLEEMEAGGVAPSYVPARNTVMLALAASLAESEGIRELFYAAHKEDHVGYPDCRPEFVSAMGMALTAGTKAKVVLNAPFISLPKSDIVRFGTQLKVPFHLTHSCYRGQSPPCGTCDTCAIRAHAFQEAGVSDPLLAGAR